MVILPSQGSPYLEIYIWYISIFWCLIGNQVNVFLETDCVGALISVSDHRDYTKKVYFFSYKRIQVYDSCNVSSIFVNIRPLPPTPLPFSPFVALYYCNIYGFMSTKVESYPNFGFVPRKAFFRLSTIKLWLRVSFWLLAIKRWLRC